MKVRRRANLNDLCMGILLCLCHTVIIPIKYVTRNDMLAGLSRLTHS